MILNIIYEPPYFIYFNTYYFTIICRLKNTAFVVFLAQVYDFLVKADHSIETIIPRERDQLCPFTGVFRQQRPSVLWKNLS